MLNKKQLKQKYGDEKVLVVPYDSLHYIPDGFTPIEHHHSIWGKFDEIGRYCYRYDVEGEPVFQQIIPYIVIVNELTGKAFVTERIKGDERLQGKLSIGAGGHINESDGNREVIFKAAVRELLEEVDFLPSRAFESIGYIRQKTSSTSDHTGIVLMAFTKADVKVNEVDVLKGQWMNLDELVNKYESFEGWGKLLIDFFVARKSII